MKNDTFLIGDGAVTSFLKRQNKPPSRQIAA